MGAACLKAVSLSLGKGRAQRGQPGRVGKALPGVDQDRCRQLQQAFSGQQQEVVMVSVVPRTWSFLALPAHGAGTLCPAEPTDPVLTQPAPPPAGSLPLQPAFHTHPGPSQLQTLLRGLVGADVITQILSLP